MQTTVRRAPVFLVVLLTACESSPTGDDPGSGSGQVPGLAAASAVAAGTDHSCRIESSGVASCWGANRYGALGDGSTTDAPSPVLVTGGHRFGAVAAGNGFSCALTEDGDAFCWGLNTHGEVGDGTTSSRTIPTPVAGGHKFVRITAGSFHACGLERSGAAYCWGLNDSGQLGSGGIDASSTPRLVFGSRTFTEVSAGGLHTCGLSGGDPYCWGYNNMGQLGSAGGTKTTPTSVLACLEACRGVPGEGTAAAPKLAHIDAGSSHTCGIETSGQAWCWGSRWALGGSPRFDAAYAVKVAAGRAFGGIEAGAGGAVCGTDAGGVMWCWGANQQGQIGNGTTTSGSAYVETPVAVSGGLRFSGTSGGYRHSCGVTSDGATYCWGSNEYGQMGDGTRTSSTVPVRVGVRGNHAPAAPTLTVGALTTNSVAVTGSPFSDPDRGDAHTATEWVLDGTLGDWGSGALQTSGISEGSLTGFSFAGLRPSARYRVRARYRDRNGSFGGFSPVAEFTTKEIPGAVDPSGAWDLVSESGALLPVKGEGNVFRLRGELKFEIDGTWAHAESDFLYGRPIALPQITSLSSRGTYSFVQDSLVVFSGGTRFTYPIGQDTLRIGFSVYGRRPAGQSPPTLDARVRAAVAKISAMELSPLIGPVFSLSGRADYCTTRQDLVESELRSRGYAVVKDAGQWRITRMNGEILTDANICRVALLVIWLDNIPAG